MKKQHNGSVKTIIIGTGAIAREHASVLLSMPNVSLVAACDLSAARVRSVADRYNIPDHFTDHKEMLRRIKADWAHVTTPPAAHFQVTHDCLMAGLNVLCEKPITENFNDFRVLRKLAEKKGVHLIENQNMRFHSSVRKIMDLIETGELGEVVDSQIQLALNIYTAGSPYVDPNMPHFTSKLPGGVIGDFMPHLAYLSSMLTGQPQKISTLWGKVRQDSSLNFDEFRCLIKGTQSTATVSFSGNAQPDGFWLKVWGTKLYVEANLFEPPRIQIRRVRYGPAPLPSLINGIGESLAVGSGTIASVWRKIGGSSSYDGLAEFIDACYSARNAGESQLVSLDEIGSNVRLVNDLTNPKFAL